MSKHKFTNLICFIIIAIAVIITVLIIAVKNGQQTKDEVNTMQYEKKLFDTDLVHSIDIQIDQSDWDKLQENASDKEYMKCDIVIDGKKFQNVAIRAKGNSSLSQVKQEGSKRYSFKIEFDHYNDGSTCWGLDKLSLNNIIQDSTYMKDFLSYTLMREMQADAPLCSYMNVTLNDQDFGLYLAVEGVEESFLERNYGSDYGNLYKPETADLNANLGNFNMGKAGDLADVFGYGYGYGYGMPDFSKMFQYSYGNGQGIPGNRKEFGGNGAGGMFGSSESASDVALKYLDDSKSSYSNIFNGAITKVTNQDKKRLISSIKQMNTGKNLEEVLNVDEILRYFVVHNFVNNYDSYTGSMLHNYYLYEKDGKLSMIAWDYNLAFGGFSMGQGMNTQADTTAASVDTATKYVNYPIDTPVSGTTMEERPLLNNLLTNEEYLAKYHEFFDEFITDYFESGYTDTLINKISTMIEPYIEKDKTAFYTVDEYKKGVSTLKEFCNLRAESIRGQLTGSIPSTSDGQKDTSSLLDASSINIEDMGSAGGVGGFGGFGKPDFNQAPNRNTGTSDASKTVQSNKVGNDIHNH